MISADPLTLQNLSTGAIIVFGLAQLLIAFWLIGREVFAVRRQTRQHAQTEQWHKETVSAWNSQHAETMLMLSQQREADILRHKEAMATLEEHREEAEHRHGAVMAQLSGVRDEQNPKAVAQAIFQEMQQSE